MSQCFAYFWHSLVVSTAPGSVFGIKSQVCVSGLPESRFCQRGPGVFGTPGVGSSSLLLS